MENIVGYSAYGFSVFHIPSKSGISYFQHPLKHAVIHTYILVRTYIHTYINTYTHTHTYACIYGRACNMRKFPESVLDCIRMYVYPVHYLCQRSYCTWVIPGSRRDVNEIGALLGYYAGYNGRLSTTFRDNLSATTLNVKLSVFFLD
jgi:hypothetical protein